DGWFPDQMIPVETALAAYTTGSAHAGFASDRGPLAVGKLADFAVLSTDVLDPEVRDRIAETKVVMTVVGGQVVHDGRR
ncbi:MAG: amidohydrolase family protein, partial [Myxococcota bacterium]